MTGPDLSIIIINFNTFDLTAQCIRSVYSKVVDLKIEVIVVDNASWERNPDDFKSLFPDIKLVRNSKNIGFAAGNNSGIEIALGRYILLLNSDTELLNNAPLICKRFLDVHPQVGVVSASLYFPDLTLQHNCQRFPGITYLLIELLRLQKLLGSRQRGKLLLGAFFNHAEIVYPDWVWGTFFMFRRSELDTFEHRKLPEDFFMYCEDMQWCMEFRKRKLKIAFLPDAKIIHHMGKSGAPKNDMMEKNHDTFMKMYYSPVHRAAIRILDRLLK